jgi:hypothetical protein
LRSEINNLGEFDCPETRIEFSENDQRRARRQNTQLAQARSWRKMAEIEF